MDTWRSFRQRHLVPRAVVGSMTGVSVLTTIALITTLTLLTLQGHSVVQGAPAAQAALVAVPAVPTCPSTQNPACGSQSVPYSHSWYIDSPTVMTELGQQDGKWLNQQAAKTNCVGYFLTVLDFGHPTTNSAGSSPLDTYAMSLFSSHAPNRPTYHQVETLAEQYIEAWHSNVTTCPHLRLALGTSNYAECDLAVAPCDVGLAGKYWDIVGHDVADYVTSKGYQGQITDIWLADDLEGSWDPWPTTHAFLDGVQTQERTYATHAHLVDYGDANYGACSEVNGDCSQRWTQANVFNAAWGMGWNLPLPETYYAGSTRKWDNVNSNVGTMQFVGAMSECTGVDPLPVGACWVQSGSGGDCQWSPTMGFTHLQGLKDQKGLAYATNMQWPHQTTTSNHGCS
jgi:hypothetical protein